MSNGRKACRVSVLHNKLRRDLMSSTGVLITILAIIAIGTGSYIGLMSAQRILENSQSSYYSRYRFADFWVDVKKAPLTAADRVATLPGLAEVDARVVFEVIVDLPNIARPISGRLISTPIDRIADNLNGLHLVQGSGFSDSKKSTRSEVILNDAFAREHDLLPGDRLELILNRKREQFIIVGTAISPEYVYMVRGEGDLVPDPKHFCVLYVPERYAREVLDYKDAFNQLAGRFAPNSAQDPELMLDRIEAMLDPFGVLATTPRERHASHRFLSDEIRGLGISAVVMPTLFLFVAALALNIVLSRLVQRQRSIIGTLKALGYSDRLVLEHYLLFGVMIGLLGGLAGAGVGMLITWGLVAMYPSFFEFPSFDYQFCPDLLLIGVLMSLGFAIAGTAKGVWTVLKLQPAEAMRPTPPSKGGSIFLEKLTFLWRRLGFRTHIALRSLARNPFRTATGIISQAIAMSLIFSTFVMFDSMWYLVEYQFDTIVHSDADIGMRDERGMNALYEAQTLPGVDEAEPALGMVFDMRNGRCARRQSVLGLSDPHRLTTPTTAEGEAIHVPKEGLVLSSKLAEILDLNVGDIFDLTPIRGRRDKVQTFVASIATSYLGLEAYASRKYLSKLVGEASAVNTVQMTIDPTKRDAFYAAIKKLPNAQGLNVRTDTKHNIEKTVVETTTASLGMLIFFAGVIAFGSMVNASLIELGDRIRDVATFRVLGYKPRHIAAIFFRQNMIIFLLGAMLAAPMGYGLVTASSVAYDTELFRMPVVISTESITQTIVICVVFVLFAQFVVWRQTQKLDWLEGIKIKE